MSDDLVISPEQANVAVAEYARLTAKGVDGMTAAVMAVEKADAWAERRKRAAARAARRAELDRRGPP